MDGIPDCYGAFYESLSAKSCEMIEDSSLKSTHAFINEICKQVKNTASEMANEYFLMNEQVRF